MSKHYFDDRGWLSAEPIEGRETDIAPPAEPAPEGYGWNFTGFVWVLCPLVTPAPPAAPPPAWAWLIDIGPFFDRFGAAKMAVLTSTDAGVRAILQDSQVRKWIDLKVPEVAQAVAYIGTKVPALTSALQAEILTTPVAETENLALRKLYFA